MTPEQRIAALEAENAALRRRIANIYGGTELLEGMPESQLERYAQLSPAETFYWLVQAESLPGWERVVFEEIHGHRVGHGFEDTLLVEDNLLHLGLSSFELPEGYALFKRASVDGAQEEWEPLPDGEHRFEDKSLGVCRVVVRYDGRVAVVGSAREPEEKVWLPDGVRLFRRKEAA